MAESSEIQTIPTTAEDDQHKIKIELPETKSNPPLPSNTPTQGDANLAPARVRGIGQFPKRGYFDVRDESKVERVMGILDILIFGASIGFFVSSFFVPESLYLLAYSGFLTASCILRLFYKWYRLQGGFDTFYSLLGDFQPGTYALIFGLWGNYWKVLLAVNVFSFVFDFINLVIQCFPSYVKIPINGKVKRFLRTKQLRDRYEDIGISGLLPCNEATNKIQKSTILDGKYYTLEKKIKHDTPINVVEMPVSNVDTHVNDVETLAETLAYPGIQKKIRWIIGTMMVSYSDDDDWVTINQKAEDRAVKTFMEFFTPQQKLNFIEMMEAWKKQPSQGILKKIGRKRSHCFTLARLIDLTNQGFSLHIGETTLKTIKVGAEVDTVVEDFIDSIWEVLNVVYNHATRQKAIIVAIIAVIVIFHIYSLRKQIYT